MSGGYEVWTSTLANGSPLRRVTPPDVAAKYRALYGEPTMSTVRAATAEEARAYEAYMDAHGVACAAYGKPELFAKADELYVELQRVLGNT